MVPITGCANSYISYVVFDQSTSTFYGAADAMVANSACSIFASAHDFATDKLAYFLWSLSTDGTCKETKLPLPEGCVLSFHS